MKFSDLHLDTSLQTSIDRLGFVDCTPIQTQAIPHIIEGRDVAGLAQTGTGKTAAFLVPLMERILRARPLPEGASAEDRERAEKRAFPDWRPLNFILILVPTRELAEQVMENIQKLSMDSGLRGISVYGGTSYDKQKEGFRNGVEFVAATPGRLIDLYKENLVDLKQVRAIIFDEADRMFDMGFKDDMKFILQRVPQNRQYLVFSATLNLDVLNTAYQFGSEPIELNMSRDQTKAENVKDEIFHCGQDEKGQHLLSLLKKYNPKQAIVFTNFKHNVDRIAYFLTENGIPGMGISSLLSQAQRNRVMESFKAVNDKNILVATDVAARGLDIKGVDLVINFDLPMDAESYVHRIGRTGRAGHIGTAFSLVSDRDVDSLMRIEDYLKNKVSVAYLEDADLLKDFKPLQSGDFHPGKNLREFRSGHGGHGSGGRPQQRRSESRPDHRQGGRPERAGSHGASDRQNRGERRPPRSHNGGTNAHHQSNGQGSAMNTTHAKQGLNNGQRFEHRNDRSNGGKTEFRRRSKPNGSSQPSSSGRHRRSRTSAVVAKKSTGLGQKVKGFFKKLFS